MTLRQIEQHGIQVPRMKPTIDPQRAGWLAGRSIARWWNLVTVGKAERRSLIKSRWNRYRRLSGLPLSK